MLSGFNDFAVDFGEDLDHDDYESVDLDMFRVMKHEIMESTGKLQLDKQKRHGIPF